MDPLLAQKLSALPRLNRANEAASIIACKICGADAPFFDLVDFQKRPNGYPFGPSGIAVTWHRCVECGFLFTPFCDDWTAADFARFIYNDDYRLVDVEYSGQRAVRMSEQMSHLLAELRGAAILDYGSGQGGFSERMTAKGFRVTGYDPFSAPSRPSGKYDVITCFEVIEHSPNPNATFVDIRSLLRDDGCVILSQPLQPNDIDAVRCNWWYISPRNGHVSTFTDRALAILAKQTGFAFHRGTNMHALLSGTQPSFMHVANRLGKGVVPILLGAPGSPSRDFYNPEVAFQWTATDTIEWQINALANPGATGQIAIPFVAEWRTGFAQECRIEVNGSIVDSSVKQSVIVAEFPLPEGDVFVKLMTPPLKEGGPRRLGLAVRIIARRQATIDGRGTVDATTNVRERP